MKKGKKLKLILQILICILIILIGIVGVYIKNGNMYINEFSHIYTLGSDINGSTVIEFSPDDTVETIYYDKDGNEVDSSTIKEENKKDYETKEIPVNLEENLNIDNYEKSFKIMKKRLEFLKADQYQIELHNKTGIISLSVEEVYLDDILSILPMEANFYLKDSKTEDVILDSTDFESVEASYAALTLEYRTYISLKLNEQGLEKVKKFEEYKIVEAIEDGKESEESSIIVMFDKDKVAEISYDDILLNRKTLRITTAKGLRDDSMINSQINLDSMSSKLATIGKMPVIYSITGEEFIQRGLGDDLNYIIAGLILVCVIISLILILKHKLKGVIGVLGFITNISIFLMIIRLTKVQISLNCFAGMFGLIILNAILIDNILKSIKNKEKVFLENIKSAYLKTLNVIVIMLIIFVVFALSGMTVINTVGLLLFWGWIVSIFGTLIFTTPMLSVICVNK